MPNAPHSLRLVPHAAERVAYSAAAADASDYAAALVCPPADDDSQPGEHIIQARRLRQMGLDVLTYAVLLERAKGRTWQQIAAALGEQDSEYVRARWEPVEAKWHRPDKYDPGVRSLEDALLLPAREAPTDKPSVIKDAERLDQWVVAHRDPSLAFLDHSDTPVTDGIELRD